MLELLKFEDTQVQIIELNGEPMFEIYSTGMALGQVKQSKNSKYPRIDRINQNLKNAEVIPVVHNGQQYINESQLYDLMLEMKTDKVRPFRKWVTSEVLPSIRKHGVYATDSTLEDMINNPEFGIKLLTELKQEREEKRLLQEQIDKQKSLVDFANTVQGSDKNILVRETSKLASNYIGVDVGEKGLYQYLRKWNLICKSHNEPTQLAYNQGILEYVERPARQYPFKAFTSMVTPKGQIYIINRLIKEFLKRTVA